MSGNVIELNVVTTLPIPVERVIRKAGEADLSMVIVIGYDKDGEFYFAGSEASGPENLWLLELARKKLLEIGDK